MIQRAKKYIEDVMISQGMQNHFIEKSVRDINYMLGEITGNYSHDHLLDSVIGIGNRYDGKLEIALDAKTICHSNGCQTFFSNISRKFFLGNHQLVVLRRNRPQIHLQSGSAVGHESIVANDSFGTVGGLLLPKQGGKNARLFSNNHVLANSNNAQIGDLIYEQGRHPIVIGALEKFLPIKRNEPNALDLAVARIDSDIPLYASKYLAPRKPILGEKVEKIGAKTGKRVGYVTSIDYTTKVDYRGFTAIFVNQVQILGANGYNFSEGGDSGSIVFSKNDDSFIGLLFAGSGNMTTANPADKVSQQLHAWGYC